VNIIYPFVLGLVLLVFTLMTTMVWVKRSPKQPKLGTPEKA
jgi:DHA1 family multidrug resistance protein-like MFS transporter